MDIQVGMWVRTKEWGIAKVHMIKDGKCINIKNKNNRLTHYFTQIGEPSSNKIDLIEVGDYVNGYKVIDIKGKEYGSVVVDKMFNDVVINDYGIKSIVTKEQFKSCEYVFEGE